LPEEQEMNKVIRILFIGNSEADIALILRELSQDGFRPVSQRVGKAEEMRSALISDHWDIIISEYSLPDFGAVDPLTIAKDSSRNLPFIFISEKIGEETAVDLLKAGAHDFVIKSNLMRLNNVITRELYEAELRREKQKANEELIKSKEHFESLINESPIGIYKTTVDEIGRAHV
jgi:phosphoserine phosphatase RsbU/P